MRAWRRRAIVAARRLADGAFLAPAIDLLLRVAEADEHLVGMLAELRGERANRAGGLRELHRDADLADLLAIGGVELDDHLARFDLRVVGDFVEGEHAADADVGLAEKLEPIVAGPGPESVCEKLLDLGALGGIEFVRDEILAAQRAAQVREEPRLDGTDGDELAVEGRIDVVVGDAAVEHGLAALGELAVGEEAGERLREERQRPVHHRDVDVLTVSGLRARHQRREHADRAVHAAAGVIGDDVVRDGGRLAGAAQEREHAGGRDVVEIVADHVAIGAVLAVAGDRAVNDLGVAQADAVVVDAQALGDAGTILLDDHVGARGEAGIDFAARPALEIEADGLLVAIERVEGIAAEAGGDILYAGGTGLLRAAAGGNAGLFDLDHLGAEIAEDHGAEGSRRELGEIEYLDAAERRWSSHDDCSFAFAGARVSDAFARRQELVEGLTAARKRRDRGSARDGAATRSRCRSTSWAPRHWRARRRDCRSW